MARSLRRQRSDTIGVISDEIATTSFAGAYRAIRLRGLRVPQDVSVVGFDNMEQIAPWLDPPLTTMQLPHYEMGRWAVEQVLSDPGDESKQEAPPQRRMPCPRIDRASVAAPSAVTS